MYIVINRKEYLNSYGIIESTTLPVFVCDNKEKADIFCKNHSVSCQAKTKHGVIDLDDGYLVAEIDYVSEKDVENYNWKGDLKCCLP